MVSVGADMHALAEELFPICRSITGDGVRRTLRILQEHLPGLRTVEVPSGTSAFDWTVPLEWNVTDAYVLDPEGEKIIDFQKSNLHVMGYSIPVDRTVELFELQEHLHSIPEQPDAIPYVTSYYRPEWGFCIAHRQREGLKPGRYRVVVDSRLDEGSLTYGELIVPGESETEIFLSTYVCHPSLANNELSGPVVTAQLGKWILSAPRRHTFRIVFIPETIGSIVYLSRHLAEMKRKVIAGFNVTCVGDERAYSFLGSRREDTLADRVALHVLGHMHPDFQRYTFLDRGSDERQYCSPGVDLPVVSVMRSRYGMYPEYHTSLDDLSLVTPKGLEGAYDVLRTCLICLEADQTLRASVLCEPQLGKRGLYPTTSIRGSASGQRVMMNLLAYSDGTRTLLGIAEKTGTAMWELLPIAETLKGHGLLLVEPSVRDSRVDE